MQLRATAGRSAAGARAALVALALLLLIAGVAVAVPAHAASGGEFVAKINVARASKGLSALAVSADLTAAAQKQANAMAAAGKIFHTPSLGASVCCWSAVGENVGYGANVEQIHAAFMASGPHAKNILDAGYTQVGVGVASAGQLLYVAEVFRTPNGSAPPPAPKASATPKATPTPKASTTPKAPATPKTSATPKAPSAPATPAASAPVASPAASEPADAKLAISSVLEALRNFVTRLDAQPASSDGIDPVSRGLDFAAAVGSISG